MSDNHKRGQAFDIIADDDQARPIQGIRDVTFQAAPRSFNYPVMNEGDKASVQYTTDPKLEVTQATPLATVLKYVHAVGNPNVRTTTCCRLALDYDDEGRALPYLDVSQGDDRLVTCPNWDAVKGNIAVYEQLRRGSPLHTPIALWPFYELIKRGWKHLEGTATGLTGCCSQAQSGFPSDRLVVTDSMRRVTCPDFNPTIGDVRPNLKNNVHLIRGGARNAKTVCCDQLIPEVGPFARGWGGVSITRKESKCTCPLWVNKMAAHKKSILSTPQHDRLGMWGHDDSIQIPSGSISSAKIATGTIVDTQGMTTALKPFATGMQNAGQAVQQAAKGMEAMTKLGVAATRFTEAQKASEGDDLCVMFVTPYAVDTIHKCIGTKFDNVQVGFSVLSLGEQDVPIPAEAKRSITLPFHAITPEVFYVASLVINVKKTLVLTDNTIGGSPVNELDLDLGGEDASERVRKLLADMYTQGADAAHATDKNKLASVLDRWQLADVAYQAQVPGMGDLGLRSQATQDQYLMVADAIIARVKEGML